MATNKITKKEKFEILRGFVPEASEQYNMLIEFIDSEIAAINKKAKKAKIRAEITKAEGDEMRAVVESALTNDWQSIASILNAIGDEEFTKGKVSARLGALIKMGIAEKESQTVDGKRVMHYRLIND